MSGCCGGGGGWSGGTLNWGPGDPGQRYKWEVHLPARDGQPGEVIVYDTDTQAYAAVAVAGGGVRRIKAGG